MRPLKTLPPVISVDDLDHVEYRERVAAVLTSKRQRFPRAAAGRGGREGAEARVARVMRDEVLCEKHGKARILRDNVLRCGDCGAVL